MKAMNMCNSPHCYCLLSAPLAAAAAAPAGLTAACTATAVAPTAAASRNEGNKDDQKDHQHPKGFQHQPPVAADGVEVLHQLRLGIVNIRQCLFNVFINALRHFTLHIANRRGDGGGGQQGEVSCQAPALKDAMKKRGGGG